MNAWLLLGVAALPYADRWVAAAYADRKDKRAKAAKETAARLAILAKEAELG